MKIFEEIPESNECLDSSLTIGSFDGVHQGHQSLIRSLVESQEKTKVLISFHPGPKSFFMKNKYEGDIISKHEKIEIIKKLNIDILCLIKFDDTIRRLTAELFLEKITFAFKPKRIIVGYNHTFGNQKKGNLNFLIKNQIKYDFKVTKIDEIANSDYGSISSSIIRNYIREGNISAANVLLGRMFSITGLVIKGKAIGRKINFPTANLKFNKKKILPKRGVYLVSSIISDTKFYGMCNVGFKPTVSSKKSISIEVHFFDLQKDIYNENITINFIKFIRNEKNFKNISILKKQLIQDKNKCLEFCNNNV